ncbi:hypothetical protein XELAEV_18037009mg [Xenopus laevis]|uniref:ABC transporter domain-containing protein n=1 Tax=Xenopus laevis TaxID=8355 RepID=A0A974CBG6_XENLA|nr:hypothetical protein XELAEV_18037009mg [Xenopus laevis]
MFFLKILKDLNLKVEAGKTIALVGASGCGKSTTIQLLQRFYDPPTGEITVDGHNIRSLNVKWLRENIGVVSQEPVLFGVSIKENIQYVREDVTDAEIEQAAKEANALQMTLYQNSQEIFQTMVGERGAQLSGGQKQRIAIARALVRNPKILLLDEATSALDTQSGAVVQSALDKARTGRTTIVIAHRLSTIRTADVIAGFHNGVVVEQGSHKELMDQKGVYYSLCYSMAFQKPDPDKRNSQTILLSLMFLVLGGISLVVKIIMGFSFGIFGENLTMRLRSLCFKALMRQAAGSRMGLITLSICTLLAAIIIAFVHGWQLTLLILACIPFMIGANFIRMKAMVGHASKDQKALEQAGKAIVKAPLYGFTYAISQCMNYFVNAAVFRFGAWLTAHCYMQFENVFIVFSAILFAAMEVGQSTSQAPDFGKSRVSAQRIMKLLERKPQIDSYNKDGDKLSSFDGNLEFKDLMFVYPTRPKVLVLQGLNVKVSRGQTLALVGSSGCGKSTSIQLLERFYDPMDGTVLADGIDTKLLNIQWLRSQLGIVSQEPILFDCSIAESIQWIITIQNPKQCIFSPLWQIVQKALDNARQGRTCVEIAHRLTTIQNADIIAVIQNGRVIEQGTHSQLLAKQGAYYALVNSQVAL